MVWTDGRNGTDYNIFAQRIDANGSVQWTLDGIPICAAPFNQEYPVIASDGAGGAMITWQDRRNGAGADIYAQHVDASGLVQWTADGIAICTAASDQWSPEIIGDGAGTAIITWEDNRSGAGLDIYAQRLNSSGAILWMANGVPICSAIDSQRYPVVVGDGTGGAIVTWEDWRNLTAVDIYAQRVDASGNTQWPQDGVAISISTNNQFDPVISGDGAGGAVIAWNDDRVNWLTRDIYAQRIDATGTVQWMANGIGICTAALGQTAPAIISDGAGGSIIAWDDARATGGNLNIYAQRVDPAGVAQWVPDGVALTMAVDEQVSPAITGDGTGGALVVWVDRRSSTEGDIYAQRIDAAGMVQWTMDGVAVCTVAEPQLLSALVGDGAGGAIIAWEDGRDATNNPEVFAQLIGGNGVLGQVGTSIGASDALAIPTSSRGFPNPAVDVLHIADMRYTSGVVLITDIPGRLVAQPRMTNGAVDVHDLAPGIYVAHLPPHATSVRFVKE